MNPISLDDDLIDRQVQRSLPIQLGTGGVMLDGRPQPLQSVASGNGRLSQSERCVEASFSGTDGSYQLRLAVPVPLVGANGITVRYRLAGWAGIKYLAVGFTEPSGFTHVKISNPLQGEWVSFSVGISDLAFGLQNDWRKERPQQIGDVRLYIKGTPGPDGAKAAVERAAIWRASDEAPPIALAGACPADRNARLLDELYQHVRDRRGDYVAVAETYLESGNIAISAEVTLEWPPSRDLPIGLEDSITFRYVWHSLQVVACLVVYARDSGRPEAILAARDLASHWLAVSYFKADADQRYAWYLHGTAERLIALLLMQQEALRLGFEHRFMARLNDAVFRHSQLMESEAFYARGQPTRFHNHGCFQDIGLMAAGALLSGLPVAKRWFARAVERMTCQVDALTVREGGFAVAVENSIKYHRVLTALTDFAGRLISAVGQSGGFAETAEGMRRWIAFLRDPRGGIPAQGDTFGSRREGSARGPSDPYEAPTFVMLDRAGYAVAKGNHQHRPFMLCVFATALSATHKHEDNLSFTLFFDDVEWLIDPSFCSYEPGAVVPAYLRSAFSHNALALEGLKYDRGPGRCTMSGASDGATFVVSGRHGAYEGVEVSRSLDGHLDRLDLRAVDRVERSAEGAEVSAHLVFHLGEGVTIEPAPDGYLLSHPASAFVLRLSCPQGRIVRGAGDGVLSSYVGYGFMEWSDSVSLFIPVAADRDIAWTLSASRRYGGDGPTDPT